MERKINAVFETTDYKKFKLQAGNRLDYEARGKLLMPSLQVFGQLQPIIINENFEITEGQARFYACRELGLPIKYIMEKGQGLDETREMNRKAKTWKIDDFVKSYADLGEVSYKYLEALKSQFPRLSYGVIATISKGSLQTGGKFSSILRDGTFRMTKDEYENTCQTIDFIKTVEHCIPKGGTSVSNYIIALASLYNNPHIDNKRLQANMLRYPSKLIPSLSAGDAIKSLDECYNYHQKNTLDILHLYRFELRKKSRRTEA